MEIKRENIRCPYCGGRMNDYKPIVTTFHNGRPTIWLLAECWSGENHKDSQRHFFTVKLREPKRAKDVAKQ